MIIEVTKTVMETEKAVCVRFFCPEMKKETQAWIPKSIITREYNRIYLEDFRYQALLRKIMFMDAAREA